MNKQIEAVKLKFEIPNIFEGMSEEEIKEYDNFIAQKEIEEEEYQRYKVFKNCGIGEMYHNCDLRNFSTELPMQKTMLNSARNFYSKVKSGQMTNLVLLGGAGEGKTTLISGLLREMSRTVKSNQFGLKQYYSICYITSKDLCDILQKTKSFNSDKSWDKTLNEFSFYDILAIDEVGKSTEKYEFEILFSVLDKRMQNKKSNIFAGNLDYDSFVDGFSDYGMSRLNIGGNLNLLQVSGIPDLRQKTLQN